MAFRRTAAAIPMAVQVARAQHNSIRKLTLTATAAVAVNNSWISSIQQKPVCTQFRFMSSSTDLEQRVIQVVQSFDRLEGAEVKSDSHFMNDLGLDSLDAVELVMAIEDEFGVEISNEDAEKIQSVADAVAYFKNK
eukprot:m.45350 g.45350  ORF g.45350 m.45350 type:complete len:136 (-) comp10232_c0_seq2:2342-2749(-)